MSDRSKVTLVLSEQDARLLAEVLRGLNFSMCDRIIHEISHALAECDCAGAKT